MSPTHSRQASSTIRSAISRALTLTALLLAPACSKSPVASISAPSAGHVGVAVQLDGSASKGSATKDTLVYEWSFWSIPAASKAKLNDASLAKPGFVPDVPGDYVVQLVVADAQSVSASVQATITVADDCRPKIASLTAMPTSPAVGQAVGLTVTPGPACSDVDGGGPVVAYQWSLVSAPAGSNAQIDQPQAEAASFTPDMPGDYEVAVMITDQSGLMSDPTATSAHLKITAAACGDNPPVVQKIQASPVSPNVNQDVQLSAQLSDADLQPPCSLPRSFTYSWVLLSLPAGSKAALNSTVATNPTFQPDLEGTYEVGLTVTDNLGRPSAQQTFSISTSTCGSSIPMATAVAPAMGQLGLPVQLGVQVQDYDNPAENGLNPIAPPSMDGGTSDAGTTDAGTADAGSTDAGTTDAGTTDAGMTDAGTTDGGMPEPGPVCALPLSFTYHWQMVSIPLGSRASFNDASLPNASFTPDAAGTYVLQVTTTASTGYTSAPSFVTITVGTCGSLPPTATVVAPNGAVTGQPVSLSATVLDPNATCASTAPFAYAWKLLQAPPGSAAVLSGLTSSGASPQIAPSFVPDRTGDYLVALVVTDQLGLSSAAATATITVADCTAPLTASITAPAGAATGQPVSVSASVTDPNTPPGTPAPGTCSAAVTPYSYAWSIVAQPAGSHATFNSAASSAPSFVPDMAGTYTVAVAVTDAAGNRAPQVSTNITVNDCGVPLTASINPVEGGAVGLPLALSATLSDPNDPGTNANCSAAVAPVTYAWSLVGLPAGSHATLNNPTAASPSFVPDLAGSYAVALQVTDAAGNRSPAVTASTTISATCQAPLTVTINGVNGAATNAPVQLSANVNDPNDPANGTCSAATAPFIYAWSLVGLPAGSKAQLDDAHASAPSFTPDLAGTYTAALWVMDQAGNRSGVVTADVTVAACNAPLTVSVQSGGSNTTLNAVFLNASVNDSNTGSSCGPNSQSSWTYAWDLLAKPAGSKAVLSNPLAMSPTFTPDVTGSYVVAVQVKDALGNTGVGTLVLPVNACGSAPNVLLSAPPASVETGQAVSVSAQVSDNSSLSCGGASVAPFSYSWTLTPPNGSAAVMTSPNSARPTFTPDQPGLYTYSVTVTDALGFQGKSNGSVSVLSCGITPMITSPGSPGFSFATFSTVPLSGSFSVPGGCATPTVSYAWTFDSLPAGSAASFNAARSQTPSFTADVPNGLWAVRLTITDQTNGASGVSTVNVTTNSCGGQPLTGVISVSLPTATAPISQTTPPGFANATFPNGASIQLDGTSSQDPNSGCAGPMSFKWSLWQLPPGSNASLNADTGGKPTVTLDQRGDYVFKLIVSDKAGLEAAPVYYDVRAL